MTYGRDIFERASCPDEEDRKSLVLVLSVMEHTPTGAMLLADVAKQEPKVVFVSGSEKAAHVSGGVELFKGGGLQCDGRTILINSAMHRNAGDHADIWLLFTLGHEFQHVWQLHRKDVIGDFFRANIAYENLHDHVFMQRLTEADAVSMGIQLCGEARKIGRLTGTDAFLPDNQYAPCIGAFCDLMARDSASVGDGRARFAAMQRWIKIAAVKDYYEHLSLHQFRQVQDHVLGQMSAIRSGIAQMQSDPCSYAEELACLFSESRWTSAKNRQALREALPMPDGKPYLDESIFSDPAWNEVEPSNRRRGHFVANRQAFLKHALFTGFPAPAPVLKVRFP